MTTNPTPVSTKPADRVTNERLWELRREAKDDPRTADEHWFILFAQAVIEDFQRIEVPAPLPVCPVTGRKFWGNLYHPELGTVATYGGPLDTYTVPALCEDGELRSERYDQDAGRWVEGGEPVGWFYEDQQAATPAPSVPLGGGEVAKSSAVCVVCGLGRHVAAHRPLVSGPNAGEPLDHAFTLHTQDAARETLIERLAFIAENGNDGVVASQTYADAAKLLRLDGNRPPPAEGPDAWCEYIAGMIECYLTIDAPTVNREAAIAGIIQRRLHWLPSFSTTSIHALDCKRSHPHESMNPMCELRTVIARLENEKARSAPVPAGVQGDAAREGGK